MELTIWHITGYKGEDDYDGPADNNIDFFSPIDASFTEEEVTNLFLSKFSKTNRFVVIKAKEIETRRIPC